MTDTDDTTSEDEIIEASFGAENRARLINAYLSKAAALTPDTAWQHVYRLLLWVDPTTGLAHCYESDKCQPGKHWYGRSLAFHDWASSSLGVPPSGLRKHIDLLFRQAASDLEAEIVRGAARQAIAAARQLKPYEGREFPRPGEDPELVKILSLMLYDHISSAPTSEQWRRIVQSIRQHLMLENKRRNLVGEGFEDVLAAVIRGTAPDAAFEVHARQPLHELPGFNMPRQGDKPNKVDLAIISKDKRKRVLVTAKWSIRADRERQFIADFGDYNKASYHPDPFQYVLVTNEFDPARLKRACAAILNNKYVFDHVVHINTGALRAAYGTPRDSGKKDSTRQVFEYVDSGRIKDLKQWLELLAAP